MKPMDDHQKQWLKSLGFAADKSIHDCNPTAETITFNTKDGLIMRQVASCYSRVMGYHRPVAYYNIGKKQEFADRTFFKESQAGRILQP